MPQTIDALFLYNEREALQVLPIVEAVKARGFQTFFWNKDLPIGDKVAGKEEEILYRVRNVIICLGNAGWGPNHLRLAQLAEKIQQKQQAESKNSFRIIPAIIGDTDSEVIGEVKAFVDLRRLELREVNDDSISELVEAMGKPGTGMKTSWRSGVVNKLIDGNEAERSNVLEQIRGMNPSDKAQLAERLRHEITVRYAPASQTGPGTASRPQEKIPRHC